MIRGWIWLAILTAALPVCRSQGIMDQVSLRSMSVGGFHLYGVSAFSGYSTSAYPQGGLANPVAPQYNQIGGDVTYGAGFSAGWGRARGKTSMSVSYSGTYGGNVRYTDLSAYSQSVNLGIGRTLGKWSLNLSATGSDSTAAQFLYLPSSLSVLTQVPATIEDLAAAFSIGQFSSSQASAMLTGASQVESPLRTVLLGDRVLSYSANAGISYARSSRLHFHFGSASAFGQSWRGKNRTPQNASPRGLGLNAGVGMTYQVSPRTSLEFSVDGNQTNNSYQKGLTTSSSAAIGRRMGPHWFASVNGGGAYTYLTQQSMGNAKTSNIIGGGSLGYQAYSYTLLGSYQRSSSGSLGLAAGTITNLSVAGTWHPRGSRLSLFSSVQQQMMRNTGFASLNGYQTSAGISWGLSDRTSLTSQYVYSFSRGTYVNGPVNYDVHSVRLSIGWSPQELRR